MSCRRLAALSLIVALAVPQSGCIGSFRLTNKVLDWNRGLGSIVVQEIVFLLFVIIPVYGATVFVDAVILNLIEAFTGSNPMAAGEPREIVVAEGVALRVERVGDELRTTLLTDGQAPVERRYTFADDGVVVADGAGAIVATASVDAYGGLALADARGTVVAEWSPAQVRAAEDALAGGDARGLAAVVRPGEVVAEAQ